MPRQKKYIETDHKLKQFIINESKKHDLSIADYSNEILGLARMTTYNYVNNGKELLYSLFKALYEEHGIEVIAPLMQPDELLINMGKFYRETGYSWILDVVRENV